MTKKPLTKVGLFKFEKKFNITSRGLFLGGQIIDGEVMPGNLVYLDDEKLSF